LRIARGIAAGWLVAAGCADGGAEGSAARRAITAGAPSLHDHAVVALLREGRVGCTGTLIDPRVVVTAAHCVAPLAPEEVRLGADPASGLSLAVQHSVAHPRFDRVALTHDLGVVIVAPAPLATFPRLPDGPIDGLAGATLRVVGYGLTGAGAAGPSLRRQGTSTVTMVLDDELLLAGAPSQSCSGDSGGPAFLDDGAGGELLVGVTSSGDRDCASFARDVRVDAELAFVRGLLPGARGGGEPCAYDANCASGSCLVPADTIRGYCSAACASDAECGGGTVCEDRRCRHPLPSPGALGAACAAHDDCEHGLCARFAGEARACSQLCFLDDPATCPAEASCTAQLDGLANACRLEPRGGCSAAPGGVPPAAVPLLTVIVVGAASRRRRRARTPHATKEAP
jgi:MYXO-CTERM domain-containing protein